MSDDHELLYSLGKSAYDAFCDSDGVKSTTLMPGAQFLPFDMTPQAVRDGWIAAAKAVMESAPLNPAEESTE